MKAKAIIIGEALKKISELNPFKVWPSGRKVARITNIPPTKINIEVAKLTSNSLLILIKVAHTDHNIPETIPNTSAIELGKKFPWSTPVIINKPIKPAEIEQALNIVRDSRKKKISIKVLQTEVR